MHIIFDIFPILFVTLQAIDHGSQIRKIKMALRVDITASTDKDANTIQYMGSEAAAVSAKERNTFEVEDSNLKKAIETYFGKKPNDAYLNSPTAFGDLYVMYGWTPVKRFLRVKNARIISFRTEEKSVEHKTFVNESSHDAKVEVPLFRQVINIASTSWTGDNSLSVMKPTQYNVNFKDKCSNINLDSINFHSFWYESDSHAKTSVIGTSLEEYVDLKAKSQFRADLVATKVEMAVEVDFEAKLYGQVAINYDPKYKGHQFWGLYIDRIMQSVGLKNEVCSTQRLDIAFYPESSVKIQMSEHEEIK